MKPTLHIRFLTGSTALLSGLAGCSSAPSQDIFGPYFPSWMLCALAGLGVTFLFHQLFVATGIDKALPAPLVVYLALAVAVAFSTWIAWFA